MRYRLDKVKMALVPMLPGERVGDRGTGEFKPIACVASGVNPEQAQELRDFYAMHGESVEVTNEGDPVYTSMRQRRRLLKLRGFHDRSAFC
ncbi:MAG: hypothetical protein WC919_02890 [Candidatus Paceibacterota bacterium]|jgi:hypothetical protein